jgi:hypothetical protein
MGAPGVPQAASTMEARIAPKKVLSKRFIPVFAF